MYRIGTVSDAVDVFDVDEQEGEEVFKGLAELSFGALSHDFDGVDTDSELRGYFFVFHVFDVGLTEYLAIAGGEVVDGIANQADGLGPNNGDVGATVALSVLPSHFINVDGWQTVALGHVFIACIFNGNIGVLTEMELGFKFYSR